MKRPPSIKDAVLDMAFWLVLGCAVTGAITATVINLIRFRQAWH